MKSDSDLISASLEAPPVRTTFGHMVPGPKGPISSRLKAQSARMFNIHPNAAGTTPDRISLWRIQPLTSVA